MSDSLCREIDVPAPSHRPLWYWPVSVQHPAKAIVRLAVLVEIRSRYRLFDQLSRNEVTIPPKRIPGQKVLDATENAAVARNTADPSGLDGIADRIDPCKALRLIWERLVGGTQIPDPAILHS